jgi:BirA family biotin operon repressor/biotin-[acetyl-CoA-carboxylase] ligase
MELRHFDELDSTNVRLKDLLLEERLPDETIVLADLQTAGKGQTGNVWVAEKGLNLTFSLLAYHIPPLPATDHFILSQIVSLSLKETFDLYLPDSIPSPCTIKWPNDIFWDDRKIAGILIENDIMASDLYHSIIGVGANINQLDFTQAAPFAVSLREVTGEEQDRFLFLERFLERFRHYRPALKTLFTRSIRAAYREALYRKGIKAYYQDADGVFAATLEEVCADGRLMLKPEYGKTRRYDFKEVQFLL